MKDMLFEQLCVGECIEKEVHFSNRIFKILVNSNCKKLKMCCWVLRINTCRNI